MPLSTDETYSGGSGLPDLRVVPVVEMPLVSLQRSPSCPCAFAVRSEELAGRDVAEIVGGQIREQRESHVRRRRAVRDHRDRMLLLVVRRQPLVVRAHEASRRTPMSGARALRRKSDLLGPEARFAPRERPAHPPGDGRRNEPQKRIGAAVASATESDAANRTAAAAAIAGAIHIDLTDAASP